MNIKINICLLMMISILSGCASTKMTSMANPQTIERNINKVLVHGDIQNLEYRRLAEEKLCKELTRNVECECLESSQVFFPGEEYSVEQIASRLNELQVDAVLTLQPTGSGITSKYVPQTTKQWGKLWQYQLLINMVVDRATPMATRQPFQLGSVVRAK